MAVEVEVSDLLRVLVTVTERAANIARIIRAEKGLFESLVEEKQTVYVQQDFKTLADVLIQSVVNYYIVKQYPPFKDHIYGEESDHFTNSQGNVIIINVNGDIEDTVQLLTMALNGQLNLAQKLAKHVYEDMSVDIEIDLLDKLKGLKIDVSNLGLWIDPIDGTNQYVKGVISDPEDGIHPNGINCAVVLLGVYSLSSGEPLLGVINQPFYILNEQKEWKGRMVWGVAMGTSHVVYVPKPFGTKRDHSKLKLCLVSSIDESEISQALSCHEWEVRHVDGCGYRLLCVVDGCADVFVLTKSSCYKWDTCGAQAILKALGGNIIRWDLLFEQDKKVPLIYNQSDNPSLEGARKWSNEGGIVGFVSTDVVHSLYTKFRH